MRCRRGIRPSRRLLFARQAARDDLRDALARPS